MGAQYQVTAPYVTVNQGDAVRGFYRGGVFEVEDTAAVKHLLRKGMVEKYTAPKPEPEAPKGEPSVKDVLAEVGDDAEKAAAALEAEEAKGDKARKSLVDGLTSILDKATAAQS